MAFTAAIKIDPTQIDALVGRGDTYFKLANDLRLEPGQIQDDYELARSDYLSAIEIDPACWYAYGKLVDIYLIMDTPDSAVELLTQGLEQAKLPRDQVLEALLKIPSELWTFT